MDTNRVTDESNTYFYHTDHLGSTVLLTDVLREVAWSAEYTPFGSITMAEGLLEKTVKFTGKDLDEDTGLYYYNARWYDREIGRFISADTYKGELEYPQTLNLYAYVLNNPLIYVDPTGHYSVPIFGDLTGISLLTGLYTNEAWRSNLDNVTNQLYFAVQGVYERWKEGAGSFYFDLYGFELEESILPNKEEFPLDGTVGSQNEEMKYNRPDIPSITDGFEPLPPEFMRPDLPIPLLDRDKSFDVEGISLYDRSIWDYVNLVEGTGETVAKYWDNAVQFKGNKVYKRNDLFDPDAISSWKVKGKPVTGTNVERMASGRAPIGYDGKSVNLHHLTQTQSGSIAEVSQIFHQNNSSIIHINPIKDETYRGNITKFY